MISFPLGQRLDTFTYYDIDDYADKLPGTYMLARLHGSEIVKTRTDSSDNLNRRLKEHADDSML